jgi:hypothetical protein
MSNSVAVCEAALPADLPNKRQVCRTVAAIDGNVGAVAGMLDQLHARMSALLRVNQDMQARMQRLERGADPATRAEIQAVRQRYATAISGMAQVLQGLRARVKGLAGPSLGVQAPPVATSAPPAASPATAAPASSAASTPAAPASSAAPAAPAPAAPDDSTRLTLADVVDAYIYHVLTLGGRFSNDQEQVTRRIGAKVRAATDPQERAALEQLYYDALLDTADLARRREIIAGLMQGFANRLLGVASGIKFDAFSTEGKPAEQFTEDLNVLLMTHLAAHGSFVDVVPSLVRLRQELTAYRDTRAAQGQYPLGPALQNIALLHEQPLVATHLADAIAAATPEQLDDMLRRLGAATSAVATASRRPSVPVASLGNLAALRGSLGSLFTRRQ